MYHVWELNKRQNAFHLKKTWEPKANVALPVTAQWPTYIGAVKWAQRHPTLMPYGWEVKKCFNETGGKCEISVLE